MTLERALAAVKPASSVGRFLAEHAPSYIPALSKLQDDPDRSVLTKIWGVPVGFQFGTALGMDGAPALITDIVTDPVGWLLTFGKAPFALTELGLARKGARGLLGTSRALKMHKVASFLERSGLVAEQAEKALAGGIVTAGRLDVHDLRKAGQVLGTATDDVDGLSKLMAFREERVGKTVRALDTARDKKLVKAELDDLQSRIDKLRRGGNERSAARRIEALEKKKVGLKEELAAERIPTRAGREEFATHQLDRIINEVRVGGIAGGQAMIAREMGNRAALVNRARRGFSTYQEYLEFEKDILKLDPSARTMQLLQQNRKPIREFVKRSLSGEAVEPLSRGGLAAQTAEGSRALLSVKLPGMEEKVLLRGERLAGAIQEAVEKGRGLLPGSPLVGSKMGKGLVAGSAKANREMNALLQASPKVADWSSVHESAMAAASAMRSVAPEPERFKHAHEAWTAERHRAEIFATRFRFEMEGAMRNMGLDPEKDGLLIQQLIDDPDLYLKRQGKTAIGRTNRETAVFGDINEAGKAAGISESHMLLAESVDTALREIGAVVMQENLVEAVHEFYFPHRISKVLDEVRWNKYLSAKTGNKPTSTFYRHGLPRVFDTVTELLKLELDGIIEVEKNPAKILQMYFEEAGRAAANKRVLRGIRRARWPIETGLLDGKTRNSIDKLGGIPLLANPDRGFGKRFSKVHYELTADEGIVSMARAIEKEVGLTGRQSKLIGKDGRVAVKKEIMAPLKNIYAPSFKDKSAMSLSEKIFDAGVRVNAYSKRGLLFWSGFHGIALSESAVVTNGSDIFRDFPSIVKGLPNTVANRSHKSFFDAEDVIQAATKTGLQLGRPLDPDIEIFQKALKAVEGKIPVLTPATRAIGKFEGMFNRSLWDYYHNGLKLYTWDTLYTRALARHPGTKATEVARAMSEHVNNSFGGQVWENFWVSKGGQRALRMFLLAPDWTVSNLKIAMDVFGNWFKKSEQVQSILQKGGFLVSPEDLLRADIRATYARQYALRTGLIFGVFANIANMAFSGHFMEDNDEGFRDQLRLPFNDEKNRPLYLRFGKQFREPFEMFHSPWKFLHRKLAYTPNQVWMQLTGRDYFGRPLFTSEDGPIQSAFKRAGEAATGFMPIPMQEFLGTGGRGEADMLGGISGVIGLPIKRPFQPGRRNPAEQAQTEAALRAMIDGASLDIPEVMGDLTDELAGNNFFEQAMQNLSVSGIPPGF